MWSIRTVVKESVLVFFFSLQISYLPSIFTSYPCLLPYLALPSLGLPPLRRNQLTAA